MTTYTADDFKRAEFAVRDNTYSARHAMRCNAESPTPWQGQYGAWRDDQMANDGWVPVQEARPLTAEGLTEDGIKRAQVAWLEQARSEGMPSAALVRLMFDAALTEPPSRPEGAEELKHPVIVALAGMDSMRVHGLTQEDVEGLCDRLAERGVRKVEDGDVR